MPLTESVNLVLANGYTRPDDPDAVAYIAAVEAADTANGQSGGLETATKMAINAFVKGCKADGIWPAIKASCILAGARTLTGALVPLVGSVQNNLSGGTYSRKTGLTGYIGSLNTNLNNNAQPQNSKHFGFYASHTLTSSEFASLLDSTTFSTGASTVILDNRTSTKDLQVRINTISIPGSTVGLAASGFYGASRATSASMITRTGALSSSRTVASEPPVSGNLRVFAPASVTLAFYSIGESLDLALLDARVTDLINAIGAAIP